MNRIVLLLITFVALGIRASAQDFTTNFKDSHIQFTIDKKLDATDVKNQNRSGTCWSFSTSSFLESEAMRMGKEPVNLSMIWVVRHGYYDRAWNFVHRQGKAQFAQGGEPHDVINCVRKYGIVPQYIYSGDNSNIDGKPSHGELEAVLTAYVKALSAMPVLSNNWTAGLNGILDAYLGKNIESFDYKDKKYTPKEFAEHLGIIPSDYIEITSFTHHAFYKPFVLEVSDNWDNGMAYNVPVDELQKIADNALSNGYTIEWASDVSEKYFSFKYGLAAVPDALVDTMKDNTFKTLYSNPVKEKEITQDIRQQAFDNLSTTDDHGMHIIGMAHDQNNNRFYMVKNSWGTERNDMKGYFYCSVPYFRYKTTCILVHKNAIPKDIAKKLGL